MCARDAAPCTCGHPNASHAYGQHLPEVGDASRIGLGACGGSAPDGQDCGCIAFDPATEDGEQRLHTFKETA